MANMINASIYIPKEDEKVFLLAKAYAFKNKKSISWVFMTALKRYFEAKGVNVEELNIDGLKIEGKPTYYDDIIGD